MTSVEQVAEALVGFINAEIMAPGHAIGPTDAFEAAGIDSMALLKVLLFIEQSYGFWMPDEDLVAEHTATATHLARYVCARHAP